MSKKHSSADDAMPLTLMSTWNPDINGGFFEYTDHAGVPNREARRKEHTTGVSKIALGQQYRAITGNYYVEMQPNFFNGGEVSVGLAWANVNRYSWLGHDHRGIGYRHDGSVWFHGVQIATIGEYGNGANVGVLVELDIGRLTFWVDGVNQGFEWIGLDAHTWYPATSIEAAGNVTVISTAADQIQFLPEGAQVWG